LTKPLSGHTLSKQLNYYTTTPGNFLAPFALVSSSPIIISTIEGCKSYLDERNIVSIAFCLGVIPSLVRAKSAAYLAQAVLYPNLKFPCSITGNVLNNSFVTCLLFSSPLIFPQS
jgi:hypothetical protein